MSGPIHETYEPPAADLAGLRSRALAVGAVGAVAAAAGAFLDPTQFFRSYLVSWLLWMGVTMGCFALALLHHLSRGAWGLMIRRPLEAASRTLPLIVLLFLPIVFGLSEIYVWAQPEKVAGDPILEYKSWWLSPDLFLLRSAFYFALWGLFVFLIDRLSARQDRTGEPELFRRMQGVAAAGLGLYCLTATFASVDWLMSLDPHWYSSLFGVYFIGGQGVAALAFVVPVALWLSRREPMSRVLTPKHFHDYGKLLLAFVMLWAYFAISQYLIIWSGNLQEEVGWFLERQQGGWEWVSLALILFHFALPFLLLLSRDIKRNARRLAVVAVALLVMRWVDLYWQAAPSFHHDGLAFHWLDLATLAGMGGLWFAYFVHQLGKRALLPVNDPFLEEALDDEHH